MASRRTEGSVPLRPKWTDILSRSGISPRPPIMVVGIGDSRNSCPAEMVAVALMFARLLLTGALDKAAQGGQEAPGQWGEGGRDATRRRHLADLGGAQSAPNCPQTPVL